MLDLLGRRLQASEVERFVFWLSFEAFSFGGLKSYIIVFKTIRGLVDKLMEANDLNNGC